MIRSTVISAALLSSLSAFAQDQEASNPPTANSYSYVELSGRLYVPENEIEWGPEPFSYLPGVGGTASAQFLPYAFAFVEAEGYRRVEGEAEIEARSLGGGVGAAYPINDQLDMLATVGYFGETMEFCRTNICFEGDADGYVVGGGFRLKANENFDLLAKYEHGFFDAEDIAGDSVEGDSGKIKLELHGGQNGHGAVGGIDILEDSAYFKLGYRYTLD
ncbi:MAG: hypothetical protein CL583_00650 [Alteromonadaceae bacterium]|mgnify:CR=1 FL=1|nr:hypothetical protein [Alteromonadaceae bacterium]|tara:strand:+ start:840 stop:1493 length:654 start_codon:yes stop_codon:yes gene_type:complete